MSLDKAIEHGKEKRKAYKPFSAKDVDHSCRNHGGCPYCTKKRLHSRYKAEKAAEDRLREYLTETDLKKLGEED